MSVMSNNIKLEKNLYIHNKTTTVNLLPELCQELFITAFQAYKKKTAPAIFIQPMFMVTRQTV